MSCFVCGAATLSRIANFEAPHLRAELRVTAAELFAILAVENANSVATRYNEPAQDVSGLRFEPRTKATNLGQLFSDLDCYSYQACESKGWKTSKAKDMIDTIRSAAIRTVPGYKEATWE